MSIAYKNWTETITIVSVTKCGGSGFLRYGLFLGCVR